MNGWMGKILLVDLTSGACSARPMEPSMAKDCIGGRRLGIYYLNKFIDIKCDPLSP
jgi:aldehyde:ferredoxin oxidoreductase